LDTEKLYQLKIGFRP